MSSDSAAESKKDEKPDIEYVALPKNWPIFWLVVAFLAALIVYACTN